jgi:hypothetical protein
VRQSLPFEPAVRPVHSHLDPIVSLLLAHGNQLSYDFAWGQDRTGYFCHLQKPLDFDLIEATFELPDFVTLRREDDAIECEKTWATIRGGVGR